MRLPHHHHSRLYRLIHSDFWRLELAIWLQTLAWALVSIFVPILLLRYGYSLEAVLVYEFVFFALDVPLNFLAREFILRWGARVTTALGIAFAAIFTAAFQYVSGGTWVALIGLAVVLAFYDTFYWVGHFYLFIQSSGKPESAGRNTGIMNSVRILGSMLGPAIGAVFLVLGGQNLLLWMSTAIFALAIIPLFTLQHPHDKPKRSMSLKEFFADAREKRDYLASAFYSLHCIAEDPIWSIFIFITIGTLNSVALLALVVSFSSIVLSYVTGVASRKSAEKIIVAGSIALALVWIARLLVANSFIYYASVLAVGFCAILIGVPIDSSIVERGRIKDALWAATLRNATGMFPGVVLFAALIPLVSIFKISFIAAALSLFIVIVVMRWFSRSIVKRVS